MNIRTWLRKMRRPFMPMLRALARNRMFIPLFAAYAARHVRALGNASATTKNNDAVRILALNAGRWRADLATLDSDPRVVVLVLPEEIQALIAAPFLHSLRAPLAGRHWWEARYRATVSSALGRMDGYLQEFLPALKRRLSFDALTTCTFYYFQDRAWESAAPKAGIPFVCLHKENQKDDAIVDQTIERYRARGYRFDGSAIGVYNRKERECLIRGGVADESRIAIVGAMRMDPLFQRLAADGLPALGRAVTLFSFRHNIGGLQLGQADTGGFSSDPDIGCIEYFDLVHATVARLALDNPETPVFIKPKWMPVWGERIRDAIRRALNVEPDTIPNLFITADKDAQSLIRMSGLVVGINSTALVEARILGRPVVIPLFAEVQGRHAGNVYFRKFMGSDFRVAGSPVELQAIAENLLRGPGEPTYPGNELVEEFLGFDDGRSRERVIGLFQDMVASQAKAPVSAAGERRT